MSIKTNNDGQLVAVIQVRQGSRTPGLHRMEDGTSLILGSDESCGLQLNAHDVSARHCVIRMTDGKLFVNDWYSNSGTYVNGEKIYCETMIRPNDQLIVGACELQFAITTAESAYSASFAAPQKEEEPTAAPATKPSDIELNLETVDSLAANLECPSDTAILESVDGLDLPKVESAPLSESRLPEPGLPEPTWAEPAPGLLEQQLADANAEIQRLREELEYQLTLQPPEPSASASDPMLADDAELMRAEIEHLHAELALRDQEWAAALETGSGGTAPAVDDAETTKLVDRRESLLDDLNEADERVRNLEELVQVADEATRAEHEERQQLETWVSEIETRIVDREQEWQAREEKLQGQLEEARAQQQEAAANLARVVGGKGAEFQEQAQQQIADLSRRNASLVAALDAARQESQRLEKLMQDAGTSGEELAEVVDQQEQMRQQEVQLAQERAVMAREKAELTRIREQLEKSTQASELTAENPDVRTRAFRQHLQEIHEREKQERKERSLASRISRLWTRLEGR